MNPNTFKNVHEYDSKLENIFVNKENFSLGKKVELINDLILKIKNQNAIKMLEIICNDLKKENSGDNYDPLNKVNCTDILADILNKNYQDILPILVEQLEDMLLLGKCPQGRTTRLLNIWVSLN